MRRLSSRGAAAAGLFAVTLGIYAGTYLLWAGGHQETYLALVRFWGIDAWHTPFLDLTTVLSWSECRHLGVDVYAANACTVFASTSNYGPLLTHLPLTRADSQLIGILQSIAFLAAAAAMLRPGTRTEWITATLALLSTATLFALERGNVDIIEFLLVAAAGVLATRSARLRWGAYVLYYVGGLLKFYPFALLLQVLRERPRTAVTAGLAALGAIGLFGWAIRLQIATIRTNLPGFDYNCDTFGARALPYGLADLLQWPEAVAMGVFAGLLAAAAVAAFMLGARIRKEQPQIDWSGPKLQYLTAGAIVMASCFLVQTNIDYRAIFFLFLLPGLFALKNAARTGALRWTFRLTIGGIVFCLWGEFIRRTLVHLSQDETMLAFFVARELVWWGVMIVALALVFAFVRQSPILLRRRA